MVGIVVDALPMDDFSAEAAGRAVRKWFRAVGRRLKTSGQKKAAGYCSKDYSSGTGTRPKQYCNRSGALVLLSLLLLLPCTAAGVTTGGALTNGSDLLSVALGNTALLTEVGTLEHLIGSYRPFPVGNEGVGTAASAIQSASPGGAEFPLPHSLYTKDTEGLWTWGNHPNMSASQMQRLQQAVRDRKDCFAYAAKDMPGYNGSVPPFTIKFKPGVDSVFTAPRRQSPLEKSIAQEKNTELHEANIIEPCKANTSNASCQHFPAKKDADGNYTDRRSTVDYRKVNQNTEPDRYRLHRADDLFHQVSNSKFFSKIDLRSGFHQIPIAEEDRAKTAFWWNNQLWQYKRLPMGLCNSPSAFQRVMDHEINSNGLNDCAVCFIDDIIIHSQTAEEHILHVQKVLDMLKGCGLRAHPGKSTFGAAVIEFLGFNVSTGGVTPTAAKVMAIKELRVPTSVAELQSVLGFMGYYRSFVPNYSQLQQPLNTLLKKGVKWEWTQEHQSAYDALKLALCQEGNALRRFDESLPCKLYTDWSHKGVGAVLSQVDSDGNERMVACISRSLNKHERNYSSFEGELLACVWAIKSFRPYLHGLPFTVITDHQPLLWLMASTDLTGKHARWALSLQDYEFKVEHRPGLKHQNADVPSRFPRDDNTDNTGARLDEEDVSTQNMHNACLAQLVGDPDTGTVLMSHLRLNLLDGLDGASAGEGFMDSFAPRADQLLDGHGHRLVAKDTPADELPASRDRLSRAKLQAQASAWVLAARAQLSEVPAYQSRQLSFSTAAVLDEHHVRPAVALDTGLVADAFFEAANSDGVTLVELFGGLAAGLQMCMDNGIRIQQYIYCDTAPEARAVAQAQVRKFLALYPDLLPMTAVADPFTALPQDVRTIQSSHLVQAGALKGSQWFVVAGWECQDLSPAGTGRGLDGPRSNTFFDLVRILGALQQLQLARPPAYLLENSPMQHNWRSSKIVRRDFPKIVNSIGQPVCLDAAQMGSYAHRVRNFWSNLSDPALVSAVLPQVQRPAGRLVNNILDTGRTSQPVKSTDFPPRYVCNRIGKPMEALPTLVAFRGSHAFREGKSGMVLDSNLGCLQEPNPDERERALGYDTGTTNRPPLTDLQRHEVTGRCMDRFAVSSLMAIYRAIHEFTRSSPTLTPSVASHTALLTGGGLSGSVNSTTVPVGEEEVSPYPLVGPPLTAVPAPPAYTSVDPALHHLHVGMCMASEVATLQEGQYNLSSRDAWLDAELLQYLQTGELPAENSGRIKQRARFYRFLDGQLQRVVGADGVWKTVPHPDVRLQLVQQVHSSMGHFGVKRTKHLLMQDWWWAGIEDDVVRVLSACPYCKQINTSFKTEQPQLRSLPIEGLMYRWSCDLAGPLPTTARNNRYLFIAIEHFSKNIEVMAIPDKEADTTAHAFLSMVLGRYGACAEVLTDQGGEWLGAFHELLEASFIDHRMTSPSHPQANGLTERAVQTFKRAISKFCTQSEHPELWDLQLQYIALGYRCSPQASTRCSPYQLLYGVSPTIPPAIKARMDFPLQFDPHGQSSGALPVPHTPEQAAQYLLERAELLRQHVAMAGDNQKIAQHRDQLRYTQKRSGLWKPTLQRFAVGDFVYRRRPNRVSTLQPRTADGVYRIQEIRDTGTLILQGRCGRLMPEHSSNCAPCHLANVDATVDPTLVPPQPDHACEVCGSPDREELMLLCDYCNAGYHTFCLQPPLTTVPPGDWVCPHCTSLGITDQDVQRRRSLAPKAKRITLFRTKAQRERDAQARLLSGRLVQWKPTQAPYTSWGKGPFIGELRYVADNSTRPRPLVATFVPGTGPSWDLATAKRHLLLENSPLLLTAASAVGLLPAAWDTLNYWVQLGQFLVPVPWGQVYAQQLFRTATLYARHPTAVSRALPPAAVAAVRKALAPGRFLRGLDGWGFGPTGTQHPLWGITRSTKVLSLQEGADFRLHPMSLQSHIDVDLRYPVDVYFTYAPTATLDAVLPLQYHFCYAMVCALVPGSYILDTNSVRDAWLARLRRDRLVRFIPVDHQRHWVWILLAKDISVFGNVDAATFARTELPFF
jgi:site-specific DNA-cytosine methylase